MGKFEENDFALAYITIPTKYNIRNVKDIVTITAKVLGIFNLIKRLTKGSKIKDRKTANINGKITDSAISSTKTIINVIIKP
jgi:hypothetical protein